MGKSNFDWMSCDGQYAALSFLCKFLKSSYSNIKWFVPEQHILWCLAYDEAWERRGSTFLERKTITVVWYQDYYVIPQCVTRDC